MLDLPQIIEDNSSYLTNFIKYQENTLKSVKKQKKALDDSASDFLYSDGLYYVEDDLSVLIERTESRVRGAKKIAFDYQNNPTKVSPYKLYLLSSLANKEHWYKVDTDTDTSGLEIKSYLSKIKYLIEENSPKPDDSNWNTIRKKYPSIMHDIINYVEKAKNKTNFLLDVSLSKGSKDYWTQCRIFELYDTIEFNNDLDPYSEPNSPSTPLHPTDTFIKFQIPEEDFQEKKRNQFILLDEISEIRKEAKLYSDFFIGKLELKKKAKIKPQ